MRYVLIALQWAGSIALAHALMLLGADEITSIERGGIRTIRSLGRILELYGLDPMPGIQAILPGIMVNAITAVLPGWLVLALLGGALTLLTRKHV